MTCPLFGLFRKRGRSALPTHLTEGKIGEKAAARFLKRHGYRIVARNFVSGKNEIDLIVSKKEYYVFCEVKTRVQRFDAPSPFGPPSAAVTKDKQHHLIAAANTFYKRHADEGKLYRFDVIEVYLSPRHRVEHIHHIERAFTG